MPTPMENLDLSDKGAMEIMRLFFTPDEVLYDRTIDRLFQRRGAGQSNFWLYWRTMFAFENWHSALEMKLYIQPLHPPHRRPARSSVPCASPEYNQYESMILPMVKYLERARGAVPLRHQGDQCPL